MIGTAVAGDAARTLGEEAAIDTRTVARLLVDLKNDRDRFDARTVLMIDEAVRTVAVRVMLTMIDTMREATELFIAEDQREEEEKLATQRATAAIAAACADLDRRYDGTHTIGCAGTEYEGVRLLGAVDIDGKRYARLQLYEGCWVCVPWIDAFAELIGQRISVFWNNDIKDEQVYRVTEHDGIIDDS